MYYYNRLLSHSSTFPPLPVIGRSSKHTIINPPTPRMAEWLKKQAEREAEKEQRRAERLQRKLAEPKHQFTDTEYQQQCHDLSERLEDSVLKGEGGGLPWEPAGAHL